MVRFSYIPSKSVPRTSYWSVLGFFYFRLLALRREQDFQDRGFEHPRSASYGRSDRYARDVQRCEFDSL